MCGLQLAAIGYDGVEIGCAAPHAWPTYLSTFLPPSFCSKLESNTIEL